MLSPKYFLEGCTETFSTVSNDSFFLSFSMGCFTDSGDYWAVSASVVRFAVPTEATNWPFYPLINGD